MFEKLGKFFNKMTKPEIKELTSKDAAKERLHLVLMQDRANVSVDFLELMKQEIIDVIKKYIVVDENSIDVRLTNQENEDGTNGAPSLYANIPIINIKNDVKAEKIKDGTLMYENGELEKAPVKENSVDEAEAEKEVEAKTEVIELGSAEPEAEEPKVEEAENVETEQVEAQEEKQEAEAVSNTEVESQEKVEEVNETADKEVVEENQEEQSEEAVEENIESSEELVIEQEEEEEAIEPVIDFSEDEEIDDEDGEDVTFDDLLKKAEEEEANKKAESKEKTENSSAPKKKKSTSKKKKR